MVMQSLRKGASGGFLKYVLFGLLGMAVGGLVVMDVRGVLGGGGPSSSDVAKVGKETISIQDFDRTLRLSLSQYNISPQQAHQIGITGQVLSGQIRSYLLLNEAHALGIEPSKEDIARYTAEAIKSYMQPGQSLQETLENVLRAQHMTEKDFLSGVSRELSSNVIMKSVRSGFVPPSDQLARDLYAFQNQTRDIDLLVFADSEIKDIPEATEEQLTRIYEAQKKQAYSIPEYRSATLAVFDPSKVEITVEVSEEDVRKAYDENLDAFKVGEQYLLTQALAETKEQADEIYATVQGGKDLKTATNDVMKNSAKYTEKIDFAVGSLLPELKAALSGREIGKVLEPVKTTLGYHVMKLDGIIPPTTRTFDTVKAQVKDELREQKEADALYEISATFDELLNDGASFDEIAKTVKIEQISIELINNAGQTQAGKDGLPQFDDSDKDEVIQSVFETNKDDPIFLQEMPSGLFVAVQLNDLVPQSYKPFEDVRAEILSAYEKKQRRSENMLRVQKTLAELSTGGVTLASVAKDLGKKTTALNAIPMKGNTPAPLTDAVLPQIFQAPLGAHVMLDLGDQYALAKISDYSLPNEAISTTAVEGIKATLIRESEDEASLMYIHALSNDYNARINQELLDSVYAQQPE